MYVPNRATHNAQHRAIRGTTHGFAPQSTCGHSTTPVSAPIRYGLFPPPLDVIVVRNPCIAPTRTLRLALGLANVLNTACHLT
jgi:hypothetical protein